MEFGHDNVRRVVEKDRLSSLPDELIQKILSCFDMKFAVQTCLLSSRWKLLWTLMPSLNFSSGKFRNLRKFAKFVTRVLSHRNHQVEVSFVQLDFHGSVNQVFLRKIANYAISHNVQELIVVSWPMKRRLVIFPPCLFSSRSLKHFTLVCTDHNLLKTPFDFPSLTTLHLMGIALCDDNTGDSVDLFSKCANLKNLTLEHFSLKDVEVFHITTPQLSSLKLTDGECSKVINLISPQLENLTVIKCSIKHLNAPLGVSSLCFRDYHPMLISKDGFHSLNKVSISSSMYSPNKAYREEDARKTINMLRELHSAKYLTLNVDIIECLSSFPDLFLHHPSPFSSLIRVTVDSRMINGSCVRKDASKVRMSTEARNFLLKNSPNASLIME